LGSTQACHGHSASASHVNVSCVSSLARRDQRSSSNSSSLVDVDYFDGSSVTSQSACNVCNDVQRIGTSATVDGVTKIQGAEGYGGVVGSYERVIASTAGESSTTVNTNSERTDSRHKELELNQQVTCLITLL